METKEPVVLLCGLLCDETVWQDIKSELNDYDVTIISFKGCDSIDMMAKKVLEESPNSFNLIGHSMGGRVALEIFKQSPYRIKRLGLFNTGVHPKSKAEVPGRQKLLDLAEDKGISFVAKEWLPPMMNEKNLSNNKLMDKLYAMVNKYSVDEFHAQINALLNRPDAREVLPKINIPTLLLSGEFDKWSPIEQHKEMEKYIKDSFLVAIEDAGHMAPTEQPILVANAIKELLEKKETKR